MKKGKYSAGLLALLVFAACSKSNTDLNTTDRTFTMQASVSNSAEVDAGTLAATKATNAQVKKFAQFMVTEHTMAQADLKNLGTSVGIAVKDTIDPLHLNLRTQLANAPVGHVFDSIYIYSQVTDHDMTIANFQTEQSSGSHQDVQNYANNYLPHIQMHRQSADSISRAFFKR
jgi:putative membrane protein